MSDAASPVKVRRLDSGGPREPGAFRCTECSWAREGVTRDAPLKHVKRSHDGRSMMLDRANKPVCKSSEHTRAIDREAQRRCRKRKKVRGDWVAGSQFSPCLSVCCQRHGSAVYLAVMLCWCDRRPRPGPATSVSGVASGLQPLLCRLSNTACARDRHGTRLNSSSLDIVPSGAVLMGRQLPACRPGRWLCRCRVRSSV